MNTQTKFRDYQPTESLYRYMAQRLRWELEQPGADEYDLLVDFVRDWLLFVCEPGGVEESSGEKVDLVAGLTREQIKMLLGLVRSDLMAYQLASEMLAAALASREEEG